MNIVLDIEPKKYGSRNLKSLFSANDWTRAYFLTAQNVFVIKENTILKIEIRFSLKIQDRNYGRKIIENKNFQHDSLINMAIQP